MTLHLKALQCTHVLRGRSDAILIMSLRIKVSVIEVEHGYMVRGESSAALFAAVVEDSDMLRYYTGRIWSCKYLSLVKAIGHLSFGISVMLSSCFAQQMK